MRTNSRTAVAALTMVVLGWTAGPQAQTEPRARAGTERPSESEQAKRVHEAAEVFAEIMRSPDSAIPEALVNRAEAIAVFPNVIKAAFGIGGQHGKGVLSVRNREAGTWSPPAFLTLTGGSWGAQIGGQSADIVLLVMNKRGVEKLLQSQFKMGGEAEVAAGPVGRRAEASTDAQLGAEILSYSRARGLFAGVSLGGAVVKEDSNDNADFYGRPLGTRDVVLATTPPASVVPQAVAAWRDTLNRYSLAATSGKDRK